MKRIPLFSIFLLAIFLVVACGTPAVTATELPAQPVATEPASQASPTGNSTTEVIITLADNTIEASLTTFQVGVPYKFVINNEGRRAHNFNINTPVSEAGSLDAALSSALLVVPREQLSVGKSVTVEYTFPDSVAGQNFEFSCLIKRHYEDEMLLPITVTN